MGDCAMMKKASEGLAAAVRDKRYGVLVRALILRGDRAWPRPRAADVLAVVFGVALLCTPQPTHATPETSAMNASEPTATVSTAQPAVADEAPTPPGFTSHRVLFIDLNNAEAEIAQFRNELPQATQAIYVLPSLQRIDGAARLRVVRVHREIETLTAEASHCAPLTKLNRSECHRLWDRLAALERERAQLTGQMAGAELKADAIKTVTGAPIDIVVISGHYQRKFFRGELAEMTDHDLLAMAEAMPSAFREARTVILLGCDTGTPEALTTLFRRVFPKTPIIIGSELPAPTRDELNNLAFIREVIRAEPALHAATNREQIARIHAALYEQRWPVTILWNQQEFFSDDWEYFAAPERSYGLTIVPRESTAKARTVTRSSFRR